MAERIESGDFVMSDVAFDEVNGIAPECGKWLKDKDRPIQRLPITNKTLQTSLTIKRLLGVENDRYGRGVGEKDIFIIASAKEHALELVSEEGRQFDVPKEKKNYKISLVCSLPEVDVACLHFIEVVKRSGAVFR